MTTAAEGCRLGLEVKFDNWDCDSGHHESALRVGRVLSYKLA